MSEVVVGDVVQVNNEFTFQGDANVYSWYLQCSDVIDSSAMDADLAEFGDDRETALLPYSPADMGFRCISTRRLWPQKSLPQVISTGNAGTFTPVNGPLPGQCSLVITLYGDVNDPDRHNRGRDFLTGLDCASQVDGVWKLGVLDQARALANMYVTMTATFVATASGNTWRIGLFSLTQAKKTIIIPPAVAPVDPGAVYFWPLEKVRARSLVRTQRRRAAQDPCEAIFDADVPAS